MTEAKTMPKSIHRYQQQISIKSAQKYINRIFKASLFEWNFVLFKFLQIKNIPVLHCKREWAYAMRPRSNQRRLMLKTGKTQAIIIPTEPPRV